MDNRQENQAETEQTKKSGTKKRVLMRFIYIPLILIIVLWTAFMIYAAKFYHAEPVALEAMESTKHVKVTEERGYAFFDGPGTETAFIFYPGAKVQTESYAPLMQRLAEAGVDAFLVREPYNLAILRQNGADDVRANHTYNHWYIGGHSLGGAVAAGYVADHLDEYDGLILMAAYPTKSLKSDSFRVLSLIGTNDQVINRDQVENTMSLMPDKYEIHKIHGGNHAQFGNYGFQKGDGVAAISAKDQQGVTFGQIMQFTAE